MDLVRQALAMTEKSYAPYSHFHVGAAVLAESGRIYTGANVENAAFGAGTCAERNAIFHAVACGERAFRAIAVCGGREGVVTSYCPPCGICRQTLREFCDPKRFEVILVKSAEDCRILTLEQLLPESFGPDALS